jgi:hypothetical protein
MRHETESHRDELHDRSYEPPAVSPLGSVDSFTQGDQFHSLDTTTDDG